MSHDQIAPGSPRYRLETRIATGGMGEVWRATDGVLGREVAVKLLKREYADDPTFRRRFEAEARNAAALVHPNIASVFDFGELPATEGGRPQPYLVMELVRGEPLSALLRGGEPMPADVAADLVAQAADGITAAHTLGIVHRDVKPANLLVMPDGTVKITDFGIARAADAVALTGTGQVVGTPQYLSPEQAEGKPASPASDIYSLGVVLYECLAGRRPFDADTPVATALRHLRDEPPPLPDDVPDHLRETVRVALAKDPSQRFASAADFATALHGGPVVPAAGPLPPAPGPDSTMVLTDGGDPDAAGPGAGAAGMAGAAGVAPPVAAAEPTGTAGAAGGGTRVSSGPSQRPPGTPPPRRRRRLPVWLPGWAPWAAGAVAVLLLLAGLSTLAGNDDSGGPRTGESASPTPSPSATRDTRVRVDPADYIGRPFAAARADLRALGFEVVRATVDNPGGRTQDTVAAVSPSGLLNPPQTITLAVFGAPPAVEPTPTDNNQGQNGENGDDQGEHGGNGDDKGQDGGNGTGDNSGSGSGDDGGDSGNGTGDNSGGGSGETAGDSGTGEGDG